MAKNSDICRTLFARLTDHYFKCNYCGTIRRQLPSSGYGNLVSHLKDKHESYVEDYEAHASSQAGNLHAHGFVNDKISNIYRWMCWVVERNMPLSEVEHPATRAIARLKPISSKTLKRYMAATAKAVEQRIASILPPCFGIKFDGWTCFLEQYVALFVVFWHEGELHKVLLAIAPLDEADQTADSHCSFIRNILGIYSQSQSPLRFLVGDNCATNQLIATKLNIPLVGCASHRFNLATQKYIAQYSELVETVGALMAALSSPNNRRELRRHTDLAPLRANATRWSSTYAMLERYVKIRDAIKHVDAVFELLPKPAAHRRIKVLVENLKAFNSVCKKLQEDDLSMAAVRVLFDRMIEMYPVTKEHLRPDARIVHSPDFESGVFKVASNRVENLTKDEIAALKPFHLQEEASSRSRDATSRRSRLQSREEDFATALLRNDTPDVPTQQRYDEIVSKIPPTSNHCERLFSQCKLILSPQRASLLPINFEILAFLRVNRTYWDAHTLMTAVIDDDAEGQ